MTERFRRGKNNRGASLVMVLLTVALIGIMVAIVLVIVLLNYKMKAVDSRSQANFYTAETAVDEIKAGLGSDVSDALSDSYVLVMQQYTASTQPERNTLFKNSYATDLRDALVDTTRAGESQEYYSLTKLTNYVTAEHLYDDATQTGIKVEAATDKEPVLAFTTKGVILKNLMVTYYDKNNYESRVKTDILLSFPDIDFTQTSTSPNLLEYALVADRSLSLDSTAGSTVVTGSLYGGKNGITLPTSSDLTVKNGKTIMTNGDITLAAGASLTTDSSAGLWARNLRITSGKLDLSGSTYIANDLAVKDQSKAASTIRLSGAYYGFGNPDTAKESNYIKDTSQTSTVAQNPANYSSAILINGVNVGIDLSRLSRLMLSGNSYVGVTLENASLASAQNAGDIRMGESLSVKSSQVAYLVPDKYVGTGSAEEISNPMTMSQYETLKAEVEAGTAAYVDTAALKAAVGATGYQTAFYPFAGGSIVYFYMTFDNADTASAYFQNYYKVNKEKTDDYMKLYTTGITYSSSASAVFNLYGNAMVYSASSGGNLKEDTNSAESNAVLKERQTGMQDMFGALGIKLITGYVNLTETEKTAGDVFTNLVYTSNLQQAVYTKDTGSHLVYAFNTANTNLRGILSTASEITLKPGSINGDNSTNVVIDNASKGIITIYLGDEASADSKKMRVLVTTGNVTVESGCDYHGLILAAGDVTVKGGAKISSSAEDVAKVLQVRDTSGSRMMDYLKDADAYVLSGAASGQAASSAGNIDISSLIVYRHWKKE